MTELELFEKAMEIADANERHAFVVRECGEDQALLGRLIKLLKSHDQASQFLQVPAVEQWTGGGETLDADYASNSQSAKDDTVDAEDDSSADDRTPDLSFLQAAKNPKAIGRLGHYEILSVLGHGGFGIVFKAFDEKLHRLVAIKTMTPQIATTSPPRKRFLREARAVAALKHENIVQIYAVEERPLPYLAMEFVDGQTLQQKLDAQGPVELPEVLSLGKQMAAGLAAAHEKGLIHRDIKPGNILIELGSQQKVKITDFGLARTADDATMTRTGTIAGTPMYMAPEQAMAQAVDHRADLFSLGSVLYQVITGRAPFRAETVLGVLKRVVEDRPRPIQEIIPETPRWLCETIEKLHEKNPEARFQSARELQDLFVEFERRLQTGEPIPSINGARKATKPLSNRLKALIAVIFILACGAVLLALPFSGLKNWMSAFGGQSNQSFEQKAKPGIESDSHHTLSDSNSGNAQLTSFIAEMKRLNPGFAGNVQSVVDGEVVTELKFETTSVTDLTPIAKLTKLRSLLACGPYYSTIKGQLSDLTPLRGLSLTHLSIDNNSVSNIDPVRGMPLVSFSAIGCAVTDLSPLAECPLETLMLWNGKCSDLRPFSKMPLKWLNVGGTGLFIDLTPLEGMPLEFLCVNATQVSDLKPLRNLPLQELLIERTKVQDLSPVLECPLTTLRFQDSLVPDPSVVRNKPLLSVSLNYAHERDQSWLSAMSTLTMINEIPASDFWQAVLRDQGSAEPRGAPMDVDTTAGDIDRRAAHAILSIEHCAERSVTVDSLIEPTLKAVNLPKAPFRLTGILAHEYRGDWNQLLSLLENCPHLGVVDLSACKINAAGLNRLAACPKLYSLNISGAVSDGFDRLQIERFRSLTCLNIGSLPLNDRILSRLKNLPVLDDLYAGDNDTLKDEWLPQLAECRALRTLWIRSTPITDAGLKHLAKMPWLKDIDIKGTRVTAAGVRELAAALPKCIIRWDGGTIEP